MNDEQIENILNNFIKTLNIINNNNDYKLGMKLESISSIERNSNNKTFFYVYTNDKKQMMAKPLDGEARPQSIKAGLKYYLENNDIEYKELSNPDNIYGKAIIKYIVENIISKSIKDKIIDSLINKKNQILSKEEIISLILEKYPNTNRTSILPTDYCFNHKNKGSSKYELFEYLDWATFRYLGANNKYNKIIYPDDIKDESLYEGTKKQITVNAYERNPKARESCIRHYGTKCFICDFDFEEIYGETGKGFIHVHHKTPLSEIVEKYKINPIKDLIPVCPNCHAMLHKRIPAYSISDIKNKIKKNL